MLDIILAGGTVMVIIVICSIAAIAIIVERLWALFLDDVAPKTQLAQVWSWIRDNELDSERLKQLRRSSKLGRILAAGLSNSRQGRDVMKDSIEEAASQVVHDLERFLGALGTIAAITPLLGLLGTVVGMINVFTALNLEGAGNAAVLAGGISKALITTAAGITVAIPVMVAHRFFVRRVDTLVVTMEQEAVKLVDALHGDRRVDLKVAS